MERDLTVPIESLPTDSLLANWQWLLPPHCEVLMVTAMGDAFVAQDDGAVSFLDTLEGTVTTVASSREAFFSLMSSGGYDEAWFNPDMIALKLSAGQRLAPGEVYSYTLPPILGAPLDSTNVAPRDAVVHFCLAGQLHQQLKELPPGYKISGFEFVEDNDPGERHAAGAQLENPLPPLKRKA